MWPSGMLPSLPNNKLTNIKILEKESSLRDHILETPRKFLEMIPSQQNLNPLIQAWQYDSIWHSMIE